MISLCMLFVFCSCHVLLYGLALPGGFCFCNCMCLSLYKAGEHVCRHCLLCDPCLLTKIDNVMKFG